MLTNLEVIRLTKNKFKEYLNSKEVLDIVLFGSSVKGKSLPNDIDVAVICKNPIEINVLGFHVSILNQDDFLSNIKTLISTLFREGYSIKYNKPFSEKYGFLSKVLFIYSLEGLSPSEKVKIVNVLRGRAGSRGLVLEEKGEWLSNNVFICLIEKENIFSKLLDNFKIKYKKSYVLIH